MEKYKYIKYVKKEYKHMTKIIKFKNGYYIPLGSKLKKRNYTIGQIDTINLIRSVQRTRTTIKDYCINNRFDYFATFTFSEDRQNIDLCREKMQLFFKAQRRKYKDFRYLVVPELHKDGLSLHFHALLGYGADQPEIVQQFYADGNPRKSKHGNLLFSHPDYNHGIHSLAVIHNSNDHNKVASYVSKYITKDMPVFSNKKRYWASKNLDLPEKADFPYLNLDGIDKAVMVYENNEIEIYEFEK